MQCCAARHILIVLKLNRWQSFKLSNSYYATILENYFRGNALSRIEMQVTYSYKSFSTTVQSSKSSLSDFLSNNINKNDKKDTEILKGNNNKLDDFVEGLGKSRLNRHQRKKNRHERRTIQNSMPSSASITVESKENINTTKALPVPVTQDLYKEKQDKYEINRPPTIIENNVIETEYKEMKQNSHMALENTKITSKLHEQNYIQHYQNNSTENIILQPSKYSAQKYVSEYERSVHNNVCIVCTSVLQEFLDNNQYEFAFTSLKEYQRQDKTPAFPILLSLANWGGHNGRPDIVKTAEAMARKYFNSLFKKYLNFENHLAIAYMKAGKVTESFIVLENFLSTYAHHKYPKISKKKKDTLALIMNFLPMEKKSFIDEAEVFVNAVVERNGRVSYALPLWKVCFVSNDYYCQQIGERLLDQHPSLVFMIGQKIKSIVDMADEDVETELLYRLLQLLLRYDLHEHLLLPTAGILKIQCESKDISMAHETLLFAKRMNIRLDPQLVQTFYKMLQEYRKRPRIFPRRAPNELPKRVLPPSVQYKF